jgi:hypothetical protein
MNGIGIGIGIDIVFAFVFIVVGFYITRALEKRHLPKITASRKKAISGEWAGVFRQDQNENREEKEFPIKLTLIAGTRSITGIMVVDENATFEFRVDGTFYHNKYLRLNYTASGVTEAAVDFGSIFLVLGDYPDRMTGKLAGYGSISESLISGPLTLEKHTNAN